MSGMGPSSAAGDTWERAEGVWRRSGGWRWESARLLQQAWVIGGAARDERDGGPLFQRGKQALSETSERGRVSIIEVEVWLLRCIHAVCLLLPLAGPTAAARVAP